MKKFVDVNDARSCLCCGQLVPQNKRVRIEDAETARDHMIALEDMGFSKEDALGPYLKHLEWQAPGLAEFIRKSLT